MAHAASIIPEPGSYGRVLQRYDRDVRFAHQHRFASYDTNLRAVRAPGVHPRHGGSGAEAVTLFFPVGKEVAAQRATRQGWLDVTEQWQQHLQTKPTDPGEADAMALVRATLDGMGWHDFLRRVQDCGIERGRKKRDQLTDEVLAYELQLYRSAQG